MTLPAANFDMAGVLQAVVDYLGPIIGTFLGIAFAFEAVRGVYRWACLALRER